MAAAFSDFFPKPYLSSGSRAEISAINSFWKGCKSSGSTFKALTSCSSFSLSFQWLGRRYGLFQLPPRFSGGLQFFRYSSGVLVAPTILA